MVGAARCGLRAASSALGLFFRASAQLTVVGRPWLALLVLLGVAAAQCPAAQSSYNLATTIESISHCTNVVGVKVCRVYATLQNAQDRLLVVTTLPTVGGPTKGIFAPNGSFYHSPGSTLLPYNPSLPRFVPATECDSFVTFGTLTNPVDANFTAVSDRFAISLLQCRAR